jgi:hypothetical protein
MASKLRLAVLVLGFTLPALAQLDSSALRAKYGSPLNREIFHMSQGFDMTVDYGLGNQVCRLQVPALMPSTDTVSNDLVQKRHMYEFLAEAVPASIRGKEGQRFSFISGMLSMSSIEYENVTVAESHGGSSPRDNTITLIFKTYGCQKQGEQ